jgi:hypothetical protein
MAHESRDEKVALANSQAWVAMEITVFERVRTAE